MWYQGMVIVGTKSLLSTVKLTKMRVDVENKDTVFLLGGGFRVIFFFSFIFSLFSIVTIYYFYRKKLPHILYILKNMASGAKRQKIANISLYSQQ